MQSNQCNQINATSSAARYMLLSRILKPSCARAMSAEICPLMAATFRLQPPQPRPMPSQDFRLLLASEAEKCR